MDSNALSIAAANYRNVFGHGVPTDVLRLYALRPGPLVMEIRQAIALSRPVPRWLAQSRTSDLAPFSSQSHDG